MAIDKRNVMAQIKAAYAPNAGGPTARRYNVSGQSNNYNNKALNAAGTNSISLYGTDALNNLLIGDALANPLATPIKLDLQLNGKIATVNPFFVNYNDVTPLQIVRIDCVYSVNAGATSVGYVSKDVVGAAPGSGSSCQSGTFNLNSTANVVLNGTLAGSMGQPSLVLGPGEQLTFNASVVGTLAGLQVTVWVRPHTGVALATYARAANGDIADGTFYLNIIPGTVIRGIAMRWGTAGTNSGTVTADVKKETSTTAPAGGTSVLAAAQSVKTTANTTVYPTLATSTATLTMAAGDRLSVDVVGTLTALANLVVTVFFASGPEQHIIIPYSTWDAVATDRTVFLADRNYIVADSWEVWSVASTSNFQLLTKDGGTTAPGAGTGLQTDNTNKGFDTNATANTPVGSLLLSAVSTKPTLWLAAGDRLGLKNVGTTGTLAGVQGAILLFKV